MIVVADGATRDFNLAFFQYCQPTHILLVCAKRRFVRERLLKNRTKAAAVLVVDTSILLPYLARNHVDSYSTAVGIALDCLCVYEGCLGQQACAHRQTCRRARR